MLYVRSLHCTHHVGRSMCSCDGHPWWMYEVSWSFSCLLTQGIFIKGFEESGGPWISQILATFTGRQRTKPVIKVSIDSCGKGVMYSDLSSALVTGLSTSVVNQNVNRKVQWSSFIACVWTFTLHFHGECNWMPEAKGNPLEQTELFFKICWVIQGNWAPRSRLPTSNDSYVYQ